MAAFVQDLPRTAFSSDTPISRTPCAKVDPHTNVDLESRSARESGLSVLKDEFRLDPATNLATRGQVASFIAAWKSAKVRVQRQAEVEAEQDTRELTKPVPTSEYLLLRQAYVKAYGTLEEKVLPSKEYLERKLLEVEHGEFKPESLQEVTARDELDPDTLIPVWDSKGQMSERGGRDFASPAASRSGGTSASTSCLS